MIALAALGLAAWTAIQTWRAEHLVGTLLREDLERAVLLTPSNSHAWARLGALREREGDATGARAALERALSVNRYSADAWVELGLHWELQGNLERAEECLREAVRVDRTFAPRWALANFYLRQQAGDRFWGAIRGAIAVNRSDPSAAFDLCWRVSQDSSLILNKAIPDDPEVYRRYYHYLAAAGRTDAIGPIWNRIEPVLTQEDIPTTLTYAESLLASGHVDFALRIWNRLCDAGLIRHLRLDPGSGRVLTNGQFRLQPSGLVFDWGLAQAVGVNSQIDVSSGPALRIAFSGTHAQETELLWQRAPAQPLQSYRLSCRYSTSGLPPDTGLYWTVQDVATGKILPAGRPLPAAEDGWSEHQSSFPTGPKTRLIRLLLAYHRAPGTTRALGWVALRDVELTPIPPPPVPRRPAAGSHP